MMGKFAELHAKTFGDKTKSITESKEPPKAADEVARYSNGSRAHATVHKVGSNHVVKYHYDGEHLQGHDHTAGSEDDAKVHASYIKQHDDSEVEDLKHE